MWSKETWGREEEKGDVDTITAKGGTRGAEEGGHDILGALMVATLALSKGTMMVDHDKTS